MDRALPLIIALLVTAVPVAAQPHRPGESFRDGRNMPVMVVVPSGKASLGSPEAETTREGRAPEVAAFERPLRDIAFERPFAIGRYHVTKREFAVFARATRRPMTGCLVVVAGQWSEGPLPGKSYADVGQRQRGDEPALCVNWDDANAYAAWLSEKTGVRYRLPTEAEWEYAARGGTQTARWWGDSAQPICTHANGGDRAYAATMPGDKTANLACSDGFAFTNPVGHFRPNPFGLHDMLGNAWQWMADCFAPVAGTQASEPCKTRSIRGGSWHNGPAVLRAATRFSLPPALRSSSLGFRVVRALD